jgi:hypothetical protein
MKCCIIFEIAGPCRWVKFEKLGQYRRVLFIWFSLAWVPYKWTEFLYRLIWAIEHKGDAVACDSCGENITDSQKNVGHECNLHEWCCIQEAP